MVKWLDTSKRILNFENKHSKERTDYIIDLGIITHSSAFRRLAHKTQVFINPDHDYVRTRLSHSLEASQISRELAKFFCEKVDLSWTPKEKLEFENISSNACLLHDIGHPPFGHVGEKIMKETWPEFEGNKQNIRIVFGQGFDDRCLGLSGPLVDSITKYKKHYTNGNKGACYETEKDRLDRNSSIVGTKSYRHPACYLMEAADDIAYICGDIEDALKLGVSDEVLKPTFEKLAEELVLEKQLGNLQGYRTSPSDFTMIVMPHLIERVKSTISALADEAKDKEELPKQMHEFLKDKNEYHLLYFKDKSSDPDPLKAIKEKFYYQHLLTTPAVCKERVAAESILKELIDIYKPLIEMSTNDVKKNNLVNTLPQHVAEHIHKCRRRLTKKKMGYLLRDFISGMTDRYAIHLWKTLKGY